MEDDKKTSEVAEETTDTSAATDNSNTNAEGAEHVADLDALRERLDSLAEASQKILDSLEAVRSSMAAFVEGGATIHEDKEDNSAEDEAEESEEAEIETPLDELDFDLDD